MNAYKGSVLLFLAIIVLALREMVSIIVPDSSIFYVSNMPDWQITLILMFFFFIGLFSDED